MSIHNYQKRIVIINIKRLFRCYKSVFIILILFKIFYDIFYPGFIFVYNNISILIPASNRLIKADRGAEAVKIGIFVPHNNNGRGVVYKLP